MLGSVLSSGGVSVSFCPWELQLKVKADGKRGGDVFKRGKLQEFTSKYLNTLERSASVDIIISEPILNEEYLFTIT